MQNMFAGIKEKIGIQTRYLIDRLMALNLFRTSRSSPATYDDERLTTRLYLVLSNLIIFILLLYMLLTKQMNIFIIDWPSQSDYERIVARYSSSSVNCPCSHIAIAYRSFVTTEASLHQVDRKKKEFSSTEKQMVSPSLFSVLVDLS